MEIRKIYFNHQNSHSRVHISVRAILNSGLLNFFPSREEVLGSLSSSGLRSAGTGQSLLLHCEQPAASSLRGSGSGNHLASLKYYEQQVAQAAFIF